MMEYEEFKDNIRQSLKQYLPRTYESWTLEINEIPKVNGYLDGLNLMPPDHEGGTPNIYLQDLYAYYQSCMDMEMVCKKAAAVFVMGMDYVAAMERDADADLLKDKIIYCLIHAEENERLLKYVPHRMTLDLALIYRVMLRAEDGGFNSAIVTHEMADEMGLSEDELYALAQVNTPIIMPPEIHQYENCFLILTNEYRLLGATVLLYPGLLRNIAESLDENLYILPSSIHETFLLPARGQDLARMNRSVIEANNTVVSPEEVLSHHVYFYDREKDSVYIPMEDTECGEMSLF